MKENKTNIKELIKNQLKELGADGLCNYQDYMSGENCGCSINELCPCEDGMNLYDCVAAKSKIIDGEEMFFPMEDEFLKAKAVLSEDEQTLIYYYDALDHTKSSKKFWVGNNKKWILLKNASNKKEQIKTVIIDHSFKNYHQLTDMSSMFCNHTSLSTIQNINNIDVSRVKKLRATFMLCVSLNVIDLSKWDVSSVKDMSYMFSECTKINNLDLSGWDVSRVENMESMFAGCVNLETLNINGWDVSSVKNVNGMFDGCKNLKKIIGLNNFKFSDFTFQKEIPYQIILNQD